MRLRRLKRLRLRHLQLEKRANLKYKNAAVGSRSAKHWLRERNRHSRAAASLLRKIQKRTPMRERAADVLVGWADAGVALGSSVVVVALAYALPRLFS